MVGVGGGPPVTDDNARRFLAEIPPNLTDEQVNALISQLVPYTVSSFDGILAGLKRAIGQLGKPADSPDKEGSATIESKTKEPATNIPPPTDISEQVSKLAAEAAGISVRDYQRGEYRLIGEAEQNDVINALLHGVSAAGRPVAGRVTAHIDSRPLDGKELHVTQTAASSVIDSQGQTVHAAEALVGKAGILHMIRKRR